MSGISGINSGILGSIMSTSMQSRTDPAEKFKQLDVDSSGALDKTELSTLAKELSKMMGKTLNVDSSITTYDADGDGSLSQEEMGTMMKDTLGPPPDAAGKISFSGTDEDQLTTLLKMLEEMSGSSSTGSLPPDPAEKFAELDADSSDGLSQTELDAMAEDFANVTGRTLDMTEAIASYDTDGDSELSQEEMDTMMEAVREKSGGPPPPPPEGGGVSQRRAADAYLANNGEDQLTQLRELLERLTGTSILSDTDTSSTT